MMMFTQPMQDGIDKAHMYVLTDNNIQTDGF